MAETGKSLAQLRDAIDGIDDQIHDLLMARAKLAGQIRAAKAEVLEREGGDMGIAYRPAREADMLRRLKARHSGALPFESVARIWREIIASLTQLQSPYGLYICGGADLMSFHDIGRFYYGASAHIHVLEDASSVVAAAAEDPMGLGLVPFPAANAAPWWLDALARTGEGLAIIAALPFFRKGGAAAQNPSILVLSHAPFEPSGDDTSLVVLTGASDLDNAHTARLFEAIGQTALVLDCRPDSSDPRLTHRLIRLSGFVAHTDALQAGLQGQAPHLITRLTLLGGYANPIREGI